MNGQCPIPSDQRNSRTSVPLTHRLWNLALGLMALALAVGVALVAALALGWNNPRPTHLPDWRPAGLPLSLITTSDRDTVTLLGWPSGDFTLEAEALPLSGPTFNGYGLVYRAQDTDHYYAFAVGSDGYYAVLRIAEGEETPLVDWQQFPHIRRGHQANRLRVICSSSTCRFYVNDEYATNTEDDTWSTGDVGLWVRSFSEESVAVQFTDVRAWTDR